MCDFELLCCLRPVAFPLGSWITYVSSLDNVPRPLPRFMSAQNGTLFGNRVLADVIKLRLGHGGAGWAQELPEEGNSNMAA